MTRLFLGAALLTLCLGCGAVGGKCDNKILGGPFCVPDSGTAAAGTTLSFEVIDQCNGGCGKKTLACAVSRDGGTITLAVAGEICEPDPRVACDLACALVPLPCQIPALEEGDYTVVSPNQTNQVLHVRDAGSVSCKALSF